MLGGIANCKGLDPIFDKHEPILADKLGILNAEIAKTSRDLHQTMVHKLIRKHQAEGSREVTDADQRRWLLPGTDTSLISAIKGSKGFKPITTKQAAVYKAAIPAGPGWQEWEVPFDTDAEWPKGLQEALHAYRQAWRAKMDEVNACIEANAEQEELVDQPDIVKGVVRVSGPFTVESVRPLEKSLANIGDEAKNSPIEGAHDDLDAFELPERDITNAANHIERMIALLKTDGLTFPDNKHLQFARLDPLESEFLHADGETAQNGATGMIRIVNVVFFSASWRRWKRSSI